MPMRYPYRLLLLLVLALPNFGSGPAAAVEYSQANRFFAGREGILILHGAVPNHRVLSIDDPLIGPDAEEEGDRILIVLHTEVTLGADAQIAQKVVIPQIKAGISRLVVVGEDVGNGFRTQYMDSLLFPDPPLDLHFDKTRLSSTETLTLNARFRGSTGQLPGTFEVAGDKLRVRLEIGCVYCPISYPLDSFDLTAQLGPFPPGEWTLEVYGSDDAHQLGYVTFHREPILVLPSPAALGDGRFTIEIPLDPPHAGEARLVGPPSADSALFYFFSPENWEVMVKVLDGCALNGFFWVFGAASTDVGYTVRVHDTVGGGTREYRHPAGTPAPAITDAKAFPCVAAAGEGGLR